LPDRWLGKEGKAIAKWNVAFSRGPRQCIGTNIAYLELHCVLAYLFSQFEFELPGGPADLLWVDRFVATNTEDIKVRVLKNRWA
jgi:cytochrome P450